MLSVFGIETTTFAGLLAAAGVAIGMAWSGLLSNFAAGIFLILLRPFKVDDFIEAGGVMGTVKEIGLFVTAIDTMDNVRVFVGNNAVFSGNIKNFHTNEFRRVDLVAQLPHGVDPRQAIEKLKVALDAIPNTVNKSDVEILEFTLAGPRPRSAPLRAQRPLLAGLLRHQRGHPRRVHRSRLPRATEPLAHPASQLDPQERTARSHERDHKAPLVHWTGGVFVLPSMTKRP